jgi:hypothetical protein
VTGGTLQLNKWQHVTVTLTGSTLKTYLNGTLVSTNNSASNNSNGTAATIGSDIVHGRPFDGNIDDVRIYNRALSDAEIRVLAVTPGPAVVGSYSSPTAGTNGGLIGLWTFDGKYLTTATATDSTGNGFNASLVSSPTPAMGKVGQGLRFTPGKLASIASPGSLTRTSNFTWSYWAKYSSYPGNSSIGIGWPSTGGYFSSLCSSCTGTPHIALGRKAVSQFDIVGSTAIALNKWYHVVTTVDGSGNVRIYVNGVLDASGSTTLTAPTGSLTISDAVFQMDGVIDDVRVYNRALSATEAYNLYKMGGK